MIIWTKIWTRHNNILMTTVTTPEYISVSVNYVGLNELLDRLLQRQTDYYDVKPR